MRLAAGERLGVYEIAALVGAGGMGEVYRARDPRLGRDVAIKVLPASLYDDPDRLRRFEQEARAAGALNHPNVLTVYDIGSHNGVPYVVSEFLEGATLGTTLGDGPLPLRKCIDYAIQVARGLAAAHSRGIVHRDLKPENLFVTREGRVKILDFGIAKLSRPESDAAFSEETASSPPRNTAPGSILGTIGYMAPEQIRGLPADSRSDIFAFGVVFYEMLFGRRAFKGDTAAETMYAILKQDPLESAGTDRTLSPSVGRVLRRCLEKNPEERFQSARDLAFHLEAISGAEEAAAPPARSTQAARGALRALAWLMAGGLIGSLSVRYFSAPDPGGITRFTIALPPSVDVRDPMTLSPDGRTLVYSGVDEAGSRLYRRTLDTLESVAIRGTEGASHPFFSADGLSVGYMVDQTIRRVPLQGGAPVTVVEAGAFLGAAWLPDDTIVYASAGRGLMRVPASGGEARALTTLDRARGESEHHSPAAVSGDRAVLFTVHSGARDAQHIDVVSLSTGERSTVVQGSGARFLPTGHIAFAYRRDGSLWVAPFDTKQLRLTGEPAAVIEGVMTSGGWSPMAAVAPNGSLAFVKGSAAPYEMRPRTFVWVDRSGREERVDAPERAWWWPRISPDGRRLGVHIMDPVNMDAWIYELDHGPLVRMTSHPLQDGYPQWTPDGKRVAFWSRQGGGPADLYVRSADLTGKDERLTNSPTIKLPFSWAANGTLLVYQEYSPDTRMDIGVVPIGGERTPALIIKSAADEGHPAVSPDGRWIAYHSNVSGRWEVYVQPFPDLGGFWQVSTQGGLSPIWSPTGRELFYRNGRAVMSVPVAARERTFTYGNPQVLFEGAYVPETADSWAAGSYALAPDGRFLMMKEQKPPTDIIMVLNWAEELARLAPAR